MKKIYEAIHSPALPGTRLPMRAGTLVVLGSLSLVCTPTGAPAQSIRQSAERLASEAVLQNDGGTRVSAARVGMGLALAAAGAAMMLVDPEQPVQPGPVSNETLIGASVDLLGGLSVRDAIALRQSLGVPVLVCEPFCPGDVDLALFGSFVAGAGAGVAATTTAIDESGWRLYRGPIQPFKERSAGLKYGGAALAIAGAALAGFWSHVPVVDRLAVTPTAGGMRVGTSVGF